MTPLYSHRDRYNLTFFETFYLNIHPQHASPSSIRIGTQTSGNDSTSDRLTVPAMSRSLATELTHAWSGSALRPKLYHSQTVTLIALTVNMIVPPLFIPIYLLSELSKLTNPSLLVLAHYILCRYNLLLNHLSCALIP